MNERFFRNVDKTIRNIVGEGDPPPAFGGKPGEPVPEVDLEDLKTFWQIEKDVQSHSGPGVSVGRDLMEQACKPGVNIEAISYRAMTLWMMNQIAPEQLAQFMPEGQPNDSVFRAAAKIPLEWIGIGIVQQGPPFDVNEFMRLCGESSKTTNSGQS